MHKCLFHCVDDNTVLGGDENPTHVLGAAKQTTSLCGVQFVTKEHWNMPNLAVIWRRVKVIICNTKILGAPEFKDDGVVGKTLTRNLSIQNMDFRQRDPERLVRLMINILSLEGTVWRGSGIMVQLNGECSYCSWK